MGIVPMFTGRTRTVRCISSVCCAFVGLALFLVAQPVSAESNSSVSANNSLNILQSRFPCLRLAAGVNSSPQFDDNLRFDIDITLGGQLALYMREGSQFVIELVPELGYSLHGNGKHDELYGHYFNGGLGIRWAWNFFGVATTTAILLGKRQDEFDLGLRNGIRLDTLFGIIGVEVSHEWRTGDAGEVHSVRILGALTLSPQAIRQAQRTFGSGNRHQF